MKEIYGKPARIHLKFIPEQMNSAMLNQSLQVKHRFSLWGFFESACRKRRSMVE
ncbi:hypothetical protein [Faecalibacterium prausnitzii]|uniref:hypothetical protein n=1 Tax=Faecalibacterium prausnitzii TaxID=853 RepID=UPI0012DFC9F9|nr:hypothetical protein [Faecalibacterium prausnitzii]